MSKKHLTLLTGLAMAALQLPFSHAAAQSDDFGIWTEANVEKKINSRLTLDAGLELRTRDDGFGELDRWSAALGATYKLTPWLKASVGYSFLSDHNHKVNDSGKKYSDYWGPRHRFNVSLTASHEIGDLTLSLRERWQYTYRPEQTADRYWNYTYEEGSEDEDYDDEEAVYGEPVTKSGFTQTHTYRGKGSNKWRNRLQLKYKLTKQWRPFINAESTIGGSGLDKMRYSIGTEYRLNKKHSFDIKYLYQRSYKDDDSEGNRHVLGLGYTFKF